MTRTRSRVSTLGAVVVLGIATLVGGLAFAVVAHADNSTDTSSRPRVAQAVQLAGGGGDSVDSASQQNNQGFLGLSVTNGSGKLTVASVVAGGPADKAGVKQGDVITAINGTNVASYADLKKALNGKHPGDTVTLAITRGGSAQNLTVTLGDATAAGIPAKPNAGSGNGGLPSLGGIGAALRQGFDNFISVQTKTKDSNGQVHTDTVVAGTVKSVSGNQVTVTLNGGSGDQTYTVDSNSHVLKGPRIGQTQNQGASALAQNDKVLVATRDGSTTATWILVVNPNGGFFGGGHNGKSAQNQPGGISFGPNGSINITLPGGQSIDVPGFGNGQAPFAPPSGGQNGGSNTNRNPFGGGNSRGPAY